MEPVWQLSLPLPAVLLVAVGLYMTVLGLGFWIRSCLQVGALVSSTVSGRTSARRTAATAAPACRCATSASGWPRPATAASRRSAPCCRRPAPPPPVPAGTAPAPASLRSASPATASASRSASSRGPETWSLRGSSGESTPVLLSLGPGGGTVGALFFFYGVNQSFSTSGVSSRSSGESGEIITFHIIF